MPSMSPWMRSCTTLSVALAWASLATAFASTVATPSASEVADRAVESWSTRDAARPAALTRLDVEAWCEALPGWLASPPPPEGTDVVIGDRVERPTGEEDRTVFTYAARLPDGRLDVVEAVVTRTGPGSEWTIERVGFQRTRPSGRAWTGALWVQAAFVVFTLAALVAAFVTRSPLRRALRRAAAALRSHRSTVAWTMIAGWAVVASGLWVGAGLPDACTVAVADVVSATLDDVGAIDALASGNVVRIALTIFVQNFATVTLTVLFPLAAAFGVPAYLFAGVSFFVQSAAFGALGLGGASDLPFVFLLFVVEFTAYFSVVAGGGMMIASWIRGGLDGLRRGFVDLASMLPWAGTWLLIGAWYESWILIVASRG